MNSVAIYTSGAGRSVTWHAVMKLSHAYCMDFNTRPTSDSVQTSRTETFGLWNCRYEGNFQAREDLNPKSGFRIGEFTPRNARTSDIGFGYASAGHMSHEPLQAQTRWTRRSVRGAKINIQRAFRCCVSPPREAQPIFVLRSLYTANFFPVKDGSGRIDSFDRFQILQYVEEPSDR